jgi:hypothetical protein
MDLEKDSFQNNAQYKISEISKGVIANMSGSIDIREKGIAEVTIKKNSFILEWRIARLNVIDKLNNRIFLISEPYWQNENNDMPETTKRRLYDVYSEYRSV